jgi:hypothetical protein
MTPDDTQDLVLQNLRALGLVAQDPDRSARISARCHAALARHSRPASQVAGTGCFGQRVLVPIGILGLCALYVVSLVRMALHLRG